MAGSDSSIAKKLRTRFLESKQGFYQNHIQRRVNACSEPFGLSTTGQTNRCRYRRTTLEGQLKFACGLLLLVRCAVHPDFRLFTVTHQFVVSIGLRKTKRSLSSANDCSYQHQRDYVKRERKKGNVARSGREGGCIECAERHALH